MIILIRHASPLINYGACGYQEAIKRMDHYNQTENIAFEEIDFFKQPLESIITDSKPVIVFTSTLPRAIKTAKYLFSSYRPIITDPLFCEFNLSLIKIPFMHLKTSTWFTLSRLAWLLGKQKNLCSFKQEKNRARKAAKRLLKDSDKNIVVLIGHGFINRFIELELKRKGWRVEKKLKSQGCFKISQLIKN